MTRSPRESRVDRRARRAAELQKQLIGTLPPENSPFFDELRHTAALIEASSLGAHEADREIPSAVDLLPVLRHRQRLDDEEHSLTVLLDDLCDEAEPPQAQQTSKAPPEPVGHKYLHLEDRPAYRQDGTRVGTEGDLRAELRRLQQRVQDLESELVRVQAENDALDAAATAGDSLLDGIDSEVSDRETAARGSRA